MTAEIETALPPPGRTLPEPPMQADVELSPEQLAAKAQQGCRDSFALLVERFNRRILNFLYQFTGNAHDAEDLTQETFLKVFHSLHRYEPRFSFATWLFTIAKRTAISHFRRLKPTEEISEDAESAGEDPAAALQNKDERTSLWDLAKKLKPNQYTVLWLRYGEGFSVAETAQIMNLTQIHVKVLLHRARTALAKSLQRTPLPTLHPHAKPLDGSTPYAALLV